MKILQIAPPWIPVPPPGYGGTEVVIENLCKGFVDLGHEVTLFATKNSHTKAKLEYVFEKSLSEMDIDWVGALPSLVHYHQAFAKAKDYDIVHAHLSSGTDIMILPFLSDLRKKGIPAVMTVHGHWPYDRYTFMDDYYRNLYAKDISIISISSVMQKLVPNEFKDLGYVHNSLDPQTMTFGKKPKDYLLWLGKIVGKMPNVQGSTIPDKGTHEAILAAKKSGEKLIIAGPVERKDPAQAVSSIRYFEKMVEPYIDGNQIQYVGPADFKMKNELMSGAKAFLTPIKWEEPFGMVIVEAMACGTPVISFNRGAAPEVIVDGQTGFLVKNVDEMVKAIGKIDQIKREDCRKHIEDHFSPRAASQKHIEIYEKEIGRIKKNIQSRHQSLPITPSVAML